MWWRFMVDCMGVMHQVSSACLNFTMGGSILAHSAFFCLLHKTSCVNPLEGTFSCLQSDCQTCSLLCLVYTWMSSVWTNHSGLFSGPGLTDPEQNTLNYLEEVAVNSARYVIKIEYVFARLHMNLWICVVSQDPSNQTFIHWSACFHFRWTLNLEPTPSDSKTNISPWLT